MNDDNRLRDLFRLAVGAQPARVDRVGGVFATVARRRRQRVAAVSGATVVAVFVATVLTTGAGGTSGLKPADRDVTPTSSATPSATATGEPGGGPADDAPGEEFPDETETPAPAEPDSPLPPGNGAEKLDVFVLLDTTSSMERFLSEYTRMLADFAAQFDANRVDVTWGLGTYKDTWDVGYGHTTVYQRVRAQGREIPDLSPAAVGPYGGGGDEPEAGTLALEGALGIGHVPYTTDTDGASFRPDARKVVLMITDAYFNQSQVRGPYPTIDETIGHLVEHDVAVVAFQALDGTNAELARRDLRRVALGTGGVAWAPLDLDGLPGREVKPGDPLVLEVDGTGDGMRDFGRALVALARRQ